MLGRLERLGELGMLERLGRLEKLRTLGRVERLRRVESRVRLELECVAGCLLVPLEEERTGLVLSLDCQYEEDGAPTDLLTHHCQRWFAKAGWDSVKTVGDVMTNMKEELGIRHCIQVGGRGGEER